MTINLNINPHLAIARERIYKDYIHVNIEISAIYDKYFKKNLTLTKNCVLRIGIKNYWINNSANIWNSLTVQLGLKMEIGYTSVKMVLKRLYKNTLLIKS
jgi:hypothetical protein